MRTLLILRGNYHEGQKEFIAQNALENYTLDLEEFRFLAGAYKYLSNGYKSLDYGNASVIARVLFEFLELRMQKGEFCVVNAPNFTSEFLKTYKDLSEKYRYELFIIDFAHLSLKECKQINLTKAKKSGIFVPEHIIEAIDFGLQKNKIPKKYTVLQPNEWQTCLYKSFDLNAYKKIHHIGDIQGCYSVLKKAFKNIKKDEFYIFLGDYIDRGIENGKVLKWLLKLKDLSNVILLEGNHERHLVKFARGQSSSSKEFNENTLKDFKKEKITAKHAKELIPKLKECFFYEFKDKKVFCSHGGLNFLPENPSELSFIPASEMIYGVGNYEESQSIAQQFCQNTPEDSFELFGHRNRFKLPVQIASRVFLLEGKVDAGGHLRVVSLDKKGFKCKEIKNNVYKKLKKQGV